MIKLKKFSKRTNIIEVERKLQTAYDLTLNNDRFMKNSILKAMRPTLTQVIANTNERFITTPRIVAGVADHDIWCLSGWRQSDIGVTYITFGKNRPNPTEILREIMNTNQDRIVNDVVGSIVKQVNKVGAVLVNT